MRKLRFSGWFAILPGLVFTLSIFAEDKKATNLREGSPPAEERQSLNWNFDSKFDTEYDNNIYKRYKTDKIKTDFLGRFYLDSNVYYLLNEKNRFNLEYQLGAKKFISETAKDSLINFIKLNYLWLIKPENNLYLNASAIRKIRNESQKLEDYSEDHLDLNLSSDLLAIDTVFRLNAKFLRFNFTNNELYSFNRHRVGGEFEKKLGQKWNLVSGYYFVSDRFTTAEKNLPNREDLKNLFLLGGSYVSTFMLSSGGDFQITGSNINQFDNKKVGLYINYIQTIFENLTFIIYIYLQLQSFEREKIEINEGKRLLSSNQEEQNFNHFKVLISRPVWKNISGEFTYQRFSNELSDVEEKYDRSIVSLGLRANF